MNRNSFDLVGIIIITIFLLSLIYAGWLSYKSIDWTVLQRMEAQKLILPTPITASPSAQATPSAK